MKFSVKLLIVLSVLGTSVWLASPFVREYLRQRNKPQWETAEVILGDAKRVIHSTGKLQPVLEVSVGSFVSGPITDLYVDFNDEVQKGDLLAKVDPRLYQASVDRDQASLLTRQAEVDRTTAQLQQSRNNLSRGQRLREKNEKYLSDREMDALRFECQALEAALEVAKASVTQAEATLKNSVTNLAYTEIRSPVDGVILDRKIGPGQTLASQFQTPELFKVAPDLREKMHVFASVDEADIGLIRDAFIKKLPVTFTVDAHPGEEFNGYIEQVRYSANEVQNVVTYPVVVAAPNPELKLLPKMTANIAFEVDSKSQVLQIPNAALRFFPENIQWVREQDRKLLDGSQWTTAKPASNQGDAQEVEPEAKDDSGAAASNVRHVWILKDDLLQAVEVHVGFAESRFTVLESGELTKGMQLVTGVKK